MNETAQNSNHDSRKQSGLGEMGLGQMPVAVVGARGYSGLELMRLLLAHPTADVVAYSANTEFRLSDELLSVKSARIPFVPVEDLLQKKLHTVFLATPAETSLELAPEFLALGANVVDLSGAFRLKAGGKEAYQTWYRLGHNQPELLAEAVYGLQPWAGCERRQTPSLIANPGCYATAVAMAVLPLLKQGLVVPESLVIDAKSGTTGGGRKASEDLLLSEAFDECRPYKVGAHQHLPEICEAAASYAGATIRPMFTTHLLPVRRGILASIYATMTPGLAATDQELEAQVTAALDHYYGDYPLVQYAPISSSRAKALSSLKQVFGTPLTCLTYAVRDGRLYMFSILDNLLKGAASQAVENWNILCGQPVTTGLIDQKHLNEWRSL